MCKKSYGTIWCCLFFELKTEYLCRCASGKYTERVFLLFYYIQTPSASDSLDFQNFNLFISEFFFYFHSEKKNYWEISMFSGKKSEMIEREKTLFSSIFHLSYLACLPARQNLLSIYYCFLSLLLIYVWK